MKSIDHPIFHESICYIQARLDDTGFDEIQQQVLERLIHTSGDFGIQSLLKFSNDACEAGLLALRAGAPIITDTYMASAAITPMAKRTLNTSVNCALDWVTNESDCEGLTRTAIGMKKACIELSNKFSKEKSPIIVIGSAPTALITVLDLIAGNCCVPNLIIGMPVGFIGVLESKRDLSNANVNHIMVEGNRGGAALAAASINALLRACIK